MGLGNGLINSSKGAHTDVLSVISFYCQIVTQKINRKLIGINQSIFSNAIASFRKRIGIAAIPKTKSLRDLVLYFSENLEINFTFQNDFF
jgi:hypothetical protein